MTERTEKVVVMIFVLFLVCSISIHAALKIGPTSSTCNKVVAFHDRLNSGLVSYADGLVLQKDMHDRVVAAQFLSSLTQRETVKVGEVLLLQHPSVYTTGTATKPTSGPFSKVTSDGEILNYEIVKVDRAGDITYHGPGQLVLYPVIDLVSIR